MACICKFHNNFEISIVCIDIECQGDSRFSCLKCLRQFHKDHSHILLLQLFPLENNQLDCNDICSTKPNIQPIQSLDQQHKKAIEKQEYKAIQKQINTNVNIPVIFNQVNIPIFVEKVNNGVNDVNIAAVEHVNRLQEQFKQQFKQMEQLFDKTNNQMTQCKAPLQQSICNYLQNGNGLKQDLQTKQVNEAIKEIVILSNKKEEKQIGQDRSHEQKQQLLHLTNNLSNHLSALQAILNLFHSQLDHQSLSK